MCVRRLIVRLRRGQTTVKFIAGERQGAVCPQTIYYHRIYYVSIDAEEANLVEKSYRKKRWLLIMVLIERRRFLYAKINYYGFRFVK